jgi:hypothetical protein
MKMSKVNSLPAQFDPCAFQVTVQPFGTIGIVQGCLFQYPCWIGILSLALNTDVFQEAILNKLEEGDLDAKFLDLQSGEAWIGKLSDLALPRQNYPWLELKWHDDRPRHKIR